MYVSRYSYQPHRLCGYGAIFIYDSCANRLRLIIVRTCLIKVYLRPVLCLVTLLPRLIESGYVGEPSKTFLGKQKVIPVE